MQDRGWREHAIGVFVVLHVVVVLTMGTGPKLTHFPEPVTTGWRSWFEFVKPKSRMYGDHLGPKQDGWGMFSGVTRTNQSLRIDVRDPSGEWRTIFVQGGYDGGWNAWGFRYYRWREFLHLFHRPAFGRGTLERFADVVAGRLADEMPDACAVRIRVMEGRIPSAKHVHEGRRNTFPKEIRRTKVHRVPGTCP